MPEPNHALHRFSFLFAQDGGYLRIPIWGHIPLSRPARLIIEHPNFVRLQRIRQLGLVHYVFPGASHTRFEHSVGTYYLAVLMLQRLILNPLNWHSPKSPKITPRDAHLFLAAALLHDIGHYPFAHLVDRIPGQKGRVFQTHEERAKAFILDDTSSGSIFRILTDEWHIPKPQQVAHIILHPQKSGLPGRMLSGILDPDKMDYLIRDAAACGVPYGTIDTDRLIESLVLDVEGSRRRLGITEKGIAPLESLIFAKYMMFRHIYWHHAVRIAVAMFTRFVQDALDAGIIQPEIFYNLSDDALIENLAGLAPRLASGDLITRLKNRALYKRGFTVYPKYTSESDKLSTSSGIETFQELYWHPCKRRENELAICNFISHAEGIPLSGFEILLDIPRATSVFDIEDFRDLRVLTDSHARCFLPFNSSGFTQMTVDFAQEFERFGRRLQVICRPDLRETVSLYRNDIERIITKS